MRIVRLRSAAAALLAGASLAACGGRPEATLWDEDTAPQVERFVRTQAWDTAWSVGGGENDTTLLKPRILVPSPEGVYVFDDIAQRLQAFDHQGRLRWAYGRVGGGPDEFRNVRDLKLAPDGSLLVLDPANVRITALDRGGRVVARIPLDRVTHAEQMVPLADGRIVLATMEPRDPLVVIDRAGAPVERANLPWALFASLEPLARQNTIASAGDGRTWVIGFVLGNGWFSYDGTRPLPFTGSWAEHSPFPRVVEERSGNAQVKRMAYYSPCSACSMSLADTTVYVHFGGVTPARKRIVDTHVVRTGRYTGSYVLPAPAVSAAVRDGSFYVVENEPYPRLLALRPKGAGRMAIAAAPGARR